MSFHLFTILAFSIVLPVFSGIIKFRQITTQRYLPVFLYVVFAFLNNLLSYMLIRNGESNHFNSNIYVLVAFGLLLWQFNTWDEKAGMKYLGVGVIFCMIWVADNFILHGLRDNNSIFRFFASFYILYYCVKKINHEIFFGFRRIISNPVFLICVGMMFHYSFKAFYESLNFFSWLFDISLIIQVNRLIAFADLITNILISIAFLCLRSKSTYYLSLRLWLS